MSSAESSVLQSLYAQKLQKLEEQKILADRMNDLLTKQGGLNESSKNTRKNLKAAIAVAKQPGYFEYYHPSDEVRECESGKTLNKLVKSLDKVHRELEQINGDIANALAARSEPKLHEHSLNSLSQWFDTYGKPKHTDNEQFTSFQSSTKIYGGTSHHRAFKSQASTMRKGRLTR